MKRYFYLLILLWSMAIAASAQGPILRQAFTTNTGPVVTNIVLSLASGGSQTPWASDIDADNFDLFDTGSIKNLGNLTNAQNAYIAGTNNVGGGMWVTNKPIVVLGAGDSQQIVLNPSGAGTFADGAVTINDGVTIGTSHFINADGTARFANGWIMFGGGGEQTNNALAGTGFRYVQVDEAGGFRAVNDTNIAGGFTTPFNANQFSTANGTTNIVSAALVTNMINSGTVALTDQATIATDSTLGTTFRVTLGGNRTLGNPTSPRDGQRYTWEVIQDATGVRTLAMDTKFAFGTDITGITLTTNATKRDFITAVYNSTADKFYVVGFVRGY